jgi:hypothetical protein
MTLQQKDPRLLLENNEKVDQCNNGNSGNITAKRSVVVVGKRCYAGMIWARISAKMAEDSTATLFKVCARMNWGTEKEPG